MEENKKITLDSNIFEIDDLSLKCKNILARIGVNSLKVLLSLTKESLIKTRGLGEILIKEIISSVHALGFVMRDEAGYDEQLNNFICSKLKIKDLNEVNTPSLEVKKRMLDLSVIELAQLVPQEYKKYFLEYPVMYRDTKLAKILEANIYQHDNENKYIGSKKADDYILRMGCSEYGSNLGSHRYLYWIKAIHELGFYFADEPKYASLMHELSKVELITENKVYTDAINTLSLTYTLNELDTSIFIRKIVKYPDMIPNLLLIYPDNPMLLKAVEQIKENQKLKIRGLK